uniref:Nitrate reductase n=2 Tax=Chlamydomonas euryale TaxID=1486919 RepID=A0A7R9V9M8_9CHLO
MEAIRALEKYSAPLLIALSAALLAWALSAAGGVGPMLSAPSQFAEGMPKEGKLLSVLIPAVTANVGFWGTLSLNIPDFTRFARSQRDQVVGQALGLPVFMALFTLLGLAVTSATVVIYGAPVIDPVQLVGKMEGTAAVCTALLGLMWATLTTNIAANVVAPANAFVNVAPRRLSFNTGALVTACIGLAIQPWKLISSSSGFINTWLVGYSALLGPVIGVVMADYWLVRRRQLDVDALYTSGPTSAYWYTGGWNPAAIAAVVLGTAPSLPGLLANAGVLQGVPPLLLSVYDAAWFVGVGVSTLVYCVLMAAASRFGSEGAPTSGGAGGAPSPA